MRDRCGCEGTCRKPFRRLGPITWRNEFAAANAELRQAESELAELRGRLGDTSKMSRSEYLMIQGNIKNDESRVQQQRKKLDLLRETADRLGVPAEFRR